MIAVNKKTILLPDKPKNLEIYNLFKQLKLIKCKTVQKHYEITVDITKNSEKTIQFTYVTKGVLLVKTNNYFNTKIILLIFEYSVI